MKGSLLVTNKVTNMSKYGEVRNDHVDENEVIHIDAWRTADDNEEGTVIALVLNGTVYYKDFDAMTDPYAQEVIQEAVEESTPKKYKTIIRQDGEAEGCSMPIQWVDNKEQDYLEPSDTMEIEIAYHSDTELTDNGYNIILLVTDPEKGWDGREAFGVSADYDTIEI